MILVEHLAIQTTTIATTIVINHNPRSEQQPPRRDSTKSKPFRICFIFVFRILSIPIMIVKKMQRRDRRGVLAVENVGVDWKTKKTDVEHVIRQEQTAMADAHVISMTDLVIEMMIITIIIAVIVVIMIENAIIVETEMISSTSGTQSQSKL